MKDRWTEEEERILREKWPTASDEELTSALPGRTLMGIKVRASVLKLVREKKGGWSAWSWSKEEMDALRQHYPTASKNDLLAMFPSRSYVSIQTRAQAMGLKRNRKVVTGAKAGRVPDVLRKWSADEEEVLRRMYPTGDMGMIMKALPGRSAASIKSRAGILGISKVRPLSPVERAVIREFAGSLSIVELGMMLPRRTPEEIRRAISAMALDDRTDV